MDTPDFIITDTDVLDISTNTYIPIEEFDFSDVPMVASLLEVIFDEQ